MDSNNSNNDAERPEPPPKSARHAPELVVDTVQLPMYTEKYMYSGTLPNTSEGMDAPQVMTEKDWEDLEASRRRQQQTYPTYQTYGQQEERSPGGYDPSQPMTPGKSTTQQDRQPRILGLRRPYFFLLLVGAPLLIIIVSVAGAVARLNTPAATTSKTGFDVAGMFIKNATGFNTHFFYQDPNLFAINRRISMDSVLYQPPRPVMLTHVPTGPVPISSTAYTNSAGTGFINLFYVMDSAIAFANITCPLTNFDDCTTMENEIVSTQLQYSVAADSPISVIFMGLGANQGLRVFYHNTDYQVAMLSFMNGVWDAGTVIGGAAVPGSGIASVIYSDGGYINVVYVDAATQMLYNILFFDTWGAPSTLTTKPIPSFDPKTQLALAYAFKHDQMYAYYTGSDRKIYAFNAVNVSNSDFKGAVSSSASGVTAPGWVNLPEHEKAWMSSSAPGAAVAAVGISDQVRFYQEIGDGFVQSKGVMGTSDFVLQKI